MKNEKAGSGLFNSTYSLFEFEPPEEDVEMALFGPPPELGADEIAALQRNVRMEMHKEME